MLSLSPICQNANSISEIRFTFRNAFVVTSIRSLLFLFLILCCLPLTSEIKQLILGVRIWLHNKLFILANCCVFHKCFSPDIAASTTDHPTGHSGSGMSWQVSSPERLSEIAIKLAWNLLTTLSKSVGSKWPAEIPFVRFSLRGIHDRRGKRKRFPH